MSTTKKAKKWQTIRIDMEAYLLAKKKAKQKGWSLSKLISTLVSL